jgi:hypothetical protein
VKNNNTSPLESVMTRKSQHRPVPQLGLVSLWRGLMRDLFEGYRPEQHYMRGPGPACRAKQMAA